MNGSVKAVNLEPEPEKSAIGSRKSFDIPEKPTHSITTEASSSFSAKDCGCFKRRWFCVQTEPRAESRALEEIARQKFDAFLPLEQLESGRLAPLFPRYLFVSFDRDAEHWKPLWSTRGVKRIISTHPDHPAPLPVGAIESLIARADPFGIVVRRGPTAVASLHPGQRVRVMVGPFADWEAVVRMDRDGRVRVLLDLFGRSTETELRRSDVAAVAR